MTPSRNATAEDPIPENGHMGRMTMRDGTVLRVARWAAASNPMGTLVLLSGRTEYIEKYFETVAELQERGFAVATLDWRGQGLSDRALEDPLLGHVADFSEYESDLRVFLEDFVIPHCPSPYRMFAHSMGGNIGLAYLSHDPETFAQAIFSAPMWGIAHRASVDRILRAAAGIGVRLGWGQRALGSSPSEPQFEGNPLTQDPQRFEAMRQELERDPALRLGPPTVRWVEAALRATATLAAPGVLEGIKTPTLLCTAGADRVVSLAAQRTFCERLPHCEQMVFEGARHEVLMERDVYRAQFWRAFDAFVGSA